MKAHILTTFQLFAVLLVLLCGCRTEGMDFAQYRNALNHTSVQLHACARADKAHPGSATDALDTLSKMWESPVSVRMTGGRTDSADLTWISTELRRIPRLVSGQRSEAIAKLAGQVDTLSSATSTPHSLRATPAAARTILKGILAESSFHPSKFDEWLQRETYKAWQAIDRVLSHIPARYSDVLGWILTGILILAGAAALVYLILSIIRIRSYETPHTREIRKSATTPPKRPSVDELLAKAEVEASQGHFRDALRKIYLASLLSLDRRGVITYTDSGTNWEYMGSLARKASPEKAGVFRAFTMLFDETVYGHTEIAEGHFEHSKRAFHELEELT